MIQFRRKKREAGVKIDRGELPGSVGTLVADLEARRSHGDIGFYRRGDITRKDTETGCVYTITGSLTRLIGEEDYVSERETETIVVVGGRVVESRRTIDSTPNHQRVSRYTAADPEEYGLPKFLEEAGHSGARVTDCNLVRSETRTKRLGGILSDRVSADPMVLMKVGLSTPANPPKSGAEETPYSNVRLTLYLNDGQRIKGAITERRF